MSVLTYVREFFRDYKVGAVNETSQEGVQFICKDIDFSKDLTIVEFGPGSGIFTHYLLSKMSPKSKLIAFETNTHFADSLKKVNDPRFSLVDRSCEFIHKEVKARTADVIISGIPFTFLSPKLRSTIVKRSQSCLHPEGEIILYQYSLLMKNTLKKSFSHVQSQKVPKTTPQYYRMIAKW